MTIIAELDAQGWGVVIASGFIGLSGLVMGVVTAVITYKSKRDTDAREDAKEQREQERATKVEEVRLAQMAATLKIEETRLEHARLALDVKTTLYEATTKQDQKMDHLTKLTNGMKTELVEEVRRAAFAAGQKDQKTADGK